MIILQLRQCLNFQVLYPKTEAASKAEEDVTVTKMLEQRNLPPHFAALFTPGKNKTHPNHVIRIKVDISVSAGMLPNNVEHWVPVATGLSEAIVHIKSKNRGMFEMHDRNPATSCSRGGVKVRVCVNSFCSTVNIFPGVDVE